MTKPRGDVIAHSRPDDDFLAARPDWLRQRLSWFMDLRFGAIIHWGPYSQWDCYESWPLVPADTWARPDHCRCWTERDRDLARFTRDYWNLNRIFNPVKFDPRAWAELLQSAGMRYVTFTTKHHDGFCLFDTATTDYRITHPDCPFHAHPRANIVREVFAACRQRDLAISCYFSKSDWHSPHYWSPDFPVVDRHPNYDTIAEPQRWQKFVEFVHRQITELMTDYGKIDALWLDGGQVRPPRQDIRMAEMAALARRLQPGLIIADRTVGGEYEDLITPEQKIPDAPLPAPWESCMTLGRSWKYVPDEEFKSAREVVAMLAETASKGGNLLLGIGPDATGVIPPEAAARLTEIGQWLALNGEAIYGTRPLAPWRADGVRFTAKDRQAYAIVLEPDEGNAAPRTVRIGGLRPSPDSPVAILDLPSLQLPWHPADDGFTVDLPSPANASRMPVVLRFTPT